MFFLIPGIVSSIGSLGGVATAAAATAASSTAVTAATAAGAAALATNAYNNAKARRREAEREARRAAFHKRLYIQFTLLQIAFVREM